MKYKNPAATSDIIIPKGNEILLIKRKYKPFKNMWALPGGFLDYGKETLEQTAIRELEEETGLEVKFGNLKLFGIYSEPNRDPRGHIISHVYVAKNLDGQANANDDAEDARFFPLDRLPKLAFDHEKILEDYKNGNNK